MRMQTQGDDGPFCWQTSLGVLRRQPATQTKKLIRRQGLDHPLTSTSSLSFADSVNINVTALSQSVLTRARRLRATAKGIFKHLPPLEILRVKWKSLFGSWLQWIVQGYDSDKDLQWDLKLNQSLGLAWELFWPERGIALGETAATHDPWAPLHWPEPKNTPQAEGSDPYFPCSYTQTCHKHGWHTFKRITSYH